MSVLIHVNQDEKLLYVQGEGVLTGKDFDGYYARLKAVSGVKVCHKALVDLSGPTVSVKQVPISCIKSMGLMFHNAPVLPRGTKMAIVVSSTLTYGFVRLFMGSRGDSIEIRPFRAMGEALAWLNVPSSAIPQVC